MSTKTKLKVVKKLDIFSPSDHIYSIILDIYSVSLANKTIDFKIIYTQKT